MKHALRALGVFLCLALVVGTGLAQAPTGGIEGTVTDQTGAVIPGATVRITEVATGRTIPLTTNSAGRYVVRNLLSGVYRIVIEAPNFKKVQRDQVTVMAGQVVNSDAMLEVGASTEVVSVTAEAVAVDTSRQTVDTVVTEKEIKEIPLFSRNFLELAALAPGTYIRDGGANDPTKEVAYRAVGIGGRGGTGTRVQIDGVDVTDETVGMTTANISQEAVSEFQLTRSSLDISTSLTSSGAVNIISRSGGNDIHGSWFWDYHNQDMGARIDYNPESQPFKRNRTGGSVGGPFMKDKLFWFGNWERTWETKQEVNTAPLFPQLNVSQGFPVDIRYAKGRADWNISPSWRLFYSFQHDYNLATGGSPVSPFQNVNWTNTSTIALNVTQPRFTHSYRFGYVNFNNRIESQELQVAFPRLGAQAYYLGVGQFQAGPNSLAPQQTYQDNFQNSYDGSAVVGKHTFRYGLNITRLVLGGFANFAGPLSVFGTYDDATVADLRARGRNLQDPLEYPFEAFSTGPNSGFFTLAAAHNLPHGGHYNTRTAWYVGDTWKVTRGLTLNLGVRWQYDTGFFNNDDRVPRDKNLERFLKGASATPKLPKTLFSPSVGFAWDPTGSGKTVIRGGFYKAYEMNIFNNILFDEFSMLPPGIGPDFYDYTHVAGPDGRPINVAGHPDGDYSDLLGRPIKDVLPTVIAVHNALNAAYAGYSFDPAKGESVFTNSLGNTFGAQVAGNQFKVPYALQFNIGVQRELRPGTVLTVDYVDNHGIGLPFFITDYERRRDAAFLNVAAARTRINTVLGGLTVDQWMAANPTRRINAFSLINDTIWPGTDPQFLRARLMDGGGFTRYRALQTYLKGSRNTFAGLRNVSWIVSYSLGRSEAAGAAGRAEFITNPQDNRNPNNKHTFGPNSLDFTHMLSVAADFMIPGGFRFGSYWTFRTAGAQTLTVPNLGGAVSGSNGFFATDINGDGTTGTTPRGDVLPTLPTGQFGRSVKSLKDLNTVIQAFNSTYAGQLTPHGKALVAAGLFTEAQLKALGAVTQAIPLAPEGNPNPWHNLLVTDLRFSRPVNLARWREGMRIVPFVDFINLFNHAPAGLYGGLGATFGSLNYNYASAAPGLQASDLDARRHRLNSTRKVQIGLRFDF